MLRRVVNRAKPSALPPSFAVGLMPLFCELAISKKDIQTKSSLLDKELTTFSNTAKPNV